LGASTLCLLTKYSINLWECMFINKYSLLICYFLEASTLLLWELGLGSVCLEHDLVRGLRSTSLGLRPGLKDHSLVPLVGMDESTSGGWALV
jgi:hypothetical protein